MTQFPQITVKNQRNCKNVLQCILMKKDIAKTPDYSIFKRNL
jgi:hypothetical protein